MKQIVINNSEIFPTIKQELINAKQSITVVTGWFTDEYLLNILIEKAKAKLSVQVVMADNIENERLNFGALTNAGAFLFKVRSDGYGMMHQKFCIIDNKLAIHGSYNWTYNARKNNHESVILTEYSQTINELNKTYSKMIENINLNKVETRSPLKIVGRNIFNNTKDNSGTDFEEMASESENSSIENDRMEQTSFAEILEELIESEIYKFDKQKFIDHGFQVAEHTNGDHQTLPNILDTIYADFINSLDIAHDKKVSLLLKIEELKNKRLNNIEIEKQNAINGLHAEAESKTSNLTNQKDTLAVEISKFQLEQQKIREKEIATIDEENNRFSSEIDKMDVEVTQSKLKWYELIPSFILFIGLLTYLFVFYSSAAYILIFGNKDAKLLQKMGQQIVPPEVFEPNAWNKAIAHGGSSVLFISLFVFIPITLALLKKFLPKSGWFANAVLYTGILIVDTYIAYAVTQAIHDVNYLSGNEKLPFEFSQLFVSSDFYLVFIMGALGLVALKIIFEKIYTAFENLDQDAISNKIKVLKKQLAKKISENEKRRKICISKITDIEQLIVVKVSDKNKLENELATILVTLNRREQTTQQKHSILTREIEDTATRYLHKIESNNLKFSVHALHDRVNTFLNGWVNFLHGQYSIPLAKQMTTNANEIKDNWLESKLEKMKIA